ncbi:unnamed protein product [Durusdinium trenchii]|uniref:EF-hand domain-containing protein n=1 Tax=Durusdinium trenchii TaxID=1381693 RepID=A0ABP0J3K2_9DINO
MSSMDSDHGHKRFCTLLHVLVSPGPMKLFVHRYAIRYALRFPRQRKLNDFVKSELQRLSSRLDATDARIQRLISGEAPANPKQFMESARGLFKSEDLHSQTSEPPKDSGTGPRPAVRFAPGAAGRRPAQPEPRLPMSRRGSAPALQTGNAWKMGPDHLEVKAQELHKACQKAPPQDVWTEPSEGITSTVLDHAEEALRRCFGKTKEGQRYANNPLLGLNAIFKRLDQNHSGKVDRTEFLQLCSILDFNGSTDLMNALFSRYDLDRSKYLSIDEFGRMLFKLDGDPHGKALSTIAKMREALALRAGGFETLKAMANQFRIMDHDKSGELTKEEFMTALDVFFNCFNLRFNAAEKLSLFSTFDRDGSGTVSYDEFIRGVRGEMNDFRLEWVNKAFSVLDKDGSGVVTTAEMSQTYDVSANPAVQSGKVTPQQAIAQFMKHFDQNSDGQITREEFTENYEWVSASIDSDDYFELMMRNAWHIAGGEGWSANTSNLRVLVKHTRSPDEVVCVLNDLGLPRDPALRTMEVVKRLKSQGVMDIAKIEFCG